MPGLLSSGGKVSSELRCRTHMLQPGWERNCVSQAPWCLQVSDTNLWRIFFFQEVITKVILFPMREQENEWWWLESFSWHRCFQIIAERADLTHRPSVVERAQMGLETPNSNPRTAIKLQCVQITWTSHLISLGIHSSLVQWGRWIR